MPNVYPPAGTILIVCAANVCRSPYAEFLLRRALPGVTVESAGATARPGDRLCAVTARVIGRESSGRGFADSHRSRRLDADTVARADLILVASDDQRRAITAIDISVRDRIFTLIEVGYGLQELREGAGAPTIRHLAAQLDAQRGVVVLPRAKPGSLLRRPEPGIDVPDAHIREARNHAVVHRTIDAAVERIVDALDRWTNTTRTP